MNSLKNHSNYLLSLQAKRALYNSLHYTALLHNYRQSNDAEEKAVYKTKLTALIKVAKGYIINNKADTLNSVIDSLNNLKAYNSNIIDNYNSLDENAMDYISAAADEIVRLINLIDSTEDLKSLIGCYYNLFSLVEELEEDYHGYNYHIAVWYPTLEF